METVLDRNVALDRPEMAVNLFGQFDRNVKIIENRLDVRIVLRDGEVRITGFESHADMAVDVVRRLIEQIRSGETIGEQQVQYWLRLIEESDGSFEREPLDDMVCTTYRGRAIKSKTYGQKAYVDALRKYPIVFGIGPAGTGKTFLAVAMAVKAYREKQVSRIVLTRPAVEAGERLGFLPGDLQNKVDPYLRPLYDALYQIMGPESYLSNMEKGIIEVAPLAYMRGRTLEEAYIILDEAQNTTPEQMKMLLTRIGVGSRAVVTGDVTQVDLPSGARSGLKEARRILAGVDGLAFVDLTDRDVVRHPLVQSIIRAYEADEAGRKLTK